MSKMPETLYQTENELKLTIKAQGKEVLVDEECCTCINIILKNDGQIMTSFLGAHNPDIVKQLERAQKAYYKEIKKTLKAKYKANENPCGCSDKCTCGDDCKCTPENHCGCGGHCHEEKHSCNCNEEKHKCDCHNDKHNDCKCDSKKGKKKDCKCNDNDKNHKCKDNCECGCQENSKPKKSVQTKKKTVKK